MFGRTTRTPAFLPAGAPPEIRLPAKAASDAATYVDASSEFTGSLKIAKSLHIDGTVDGEIDCAATVTIGANGRVNAQITAECVVIDGEIHGDIEARGEIMLSKTARVCGDIMTEGIVIERGAKVEGRITIGPVKGSGPRREAEAPTQVIGASEVKTPG